MNTQKHILAISFFSLFLLPVTASAATITLHATPTTVGVGDEVLVTVLLDSTVPTNAFSGTVSYSKTALEPIAIRDGGSVISLWITHPAVSVAGAPITFAGITPGGFSGSGGALFSVLFRAKTAGTANLSLEDIEVLRNDGAGGNEPTTTKSLTLSVGTKPSGGYTEPEDTIQPETFTAQLSTDPQLFGGKTYLAFSTVDKSSGVEHYAVVESRLPSFLFWLFPLSWDTTATSPYVLVNQNRTSTVYIKAVDRAGNERLSVFPPYRLFTTYEKVVFLVILLVLAVLFLLVRWGRRWKL